MIQHINIVSYKCVKCKFSRQRGISSTVTITKINKNSIKVTNKYVDSTNKKVQQTRKNFHFNCYHIKCYKQTASFCYTL